MTTNPPQEPTVDPDFTTRYRDVIAGWQAGDITAQSAEATLENMLEEATRDGNALHKGRIELNIGIIEGYLGNLVACARHFELARQQFLSANAPSQVALCDLNIGETYRLQGNFNRAQMFFRRAYEEATRLNMPRIRANALTNEGQMWLSSGSIATASKCLHQAVEIGKDPYPDEDEHIYKNRVGVLAEIYMALTQIALLEDDAEAAWLLAQQSYQYATESNQPLRLGFGNRAIADAITALGHAPNDDFEDNPDHYYRIALQQFEQIKAEGDIAKTLFARGNSLAKRGRKTVAAKLYQRSLAIFSQLGMTDDVSKVAKAQRDATL